MTASTHLEYEDQATGANNNTWGDVADENFRIFEKAITDTSLQIATTGGTTTLTVEQNRVPMFRIAGVLTSNATIRVKDTGRKIFWVQNSTTGAFTVTVTTVSGTGVTIPQRRFVMLWSDGTNITHGRVAGTIPYAAAAGTVDALTATFEPPFVATELVDGAAVTVLASGANATTTPTLAVDGLTARTIVRLNGAALVAGDIAGANHPLHLVYSATGTVWRLLNPAMADGAKTTVANTFTATQTIQDTDAGAATGPIAILDRFSASPAANDYIGSVYFRGRNSAAASMDYAKWSAQILDATAGSEDSVLFASVRIAGAESNQLLIRDGVYLTGATGSAKGTGTFNAVDYYQNGSPLWRPVYKTSDTTRTTASTTISNDPDLTFPVLANTKYAFRFHAWFDSPPTDDFRFGIDGPATPTIFRAAYTYMDPDSADVTATLAAYETTGINVLYATLTNGGYVSINGIIQNAANAGNVVFMWGKGTAAANNTTVRAGSYVEYAVLG